MEIRIHSIDGSIATFVQDDPASIEQILTSINPINVFSHQRILIAGNYSLSAFIAAHVNKIEFLNEKGVDWSFAPGFSDIVEISEKRFRQSARLDEPLKMEKRAKSEVAGDLFVTFLDIHMTGGSHVFLGLEGAVALAAERFAKLQYLLSTPSLHIRLPTGGDALLNFRNVLRFTSFPGPPTAPSDAWPAHHKLKTEKARAT
jgi:hypothetical protein